jgi:hypothetical protein
VNKLKLVKSMERVHNTGIPVVHYWRPFLPQNSSIKQIQEVLDIVTKYAKVSVISGLKLNPGIKKEMINFWPQLEQIPDNQLSNISNIWPKGVKNVIKSITQTYYPNYPIVETNSCAIAIVKKISDYNDIYETSLCKSNICSSSQKDICGNVNANGFSKLEIQYQLFKVGYIGGFHYENSTLILHENIEHGAYLHLRQTLNNKINCLNSITTNHEWAGLAVGNTDIEI